MYLKSVSYNRKVLNDLFHVVSQTGTTFFLTKIYIPVQHLPVTATQMKRENAYIETKLVENLSKIQ